jgi:hypothetical protein
VLGNAGTLMVMRISPADADILAPEFHPLPAHELVDQSPYRAWLRRSGSRPVWISQPLIAPQNRRTKVIRQSRRNFGRPRPLNER